MRIPHGALDWLREVPDTPPVGIDPTLDVKSLAQALSGTCRDALLTLALFQREVNDIIAFHQEAESSNSGDPHADAIAEVEFLSRHDIRAMGSVPVILARLFVYTLASGVAIAEQFRSHFKKSSDPAKAFKATMKSLRRDIPQITEVRDSVAHPEDRARQRSKKGRIPAGIFEQSNLYGDEPRYTVADGSLGIVRVNKATLDAYCKHISALLEAIYGPPTPPPTSA